MNASSAVRALTRRLLLLALLFCAATCRAQDTEQIRGEPGDATAVREQIAKIEKRLPEIPDRAAALYLLAALKQHLGETREALQNLKDCVALKEGFDPSGSPSLGALKGTKEFDDLVAAVHRDFPVVSHAKLALTSEEKDLIPEGLAYDPRKNVFLLSSMHQRKIVAIGAADGKGADFIPAGFGHILPVLGIRPDPNDGTVWASSWDENGDRSELLHFDSAGIILGRYSVSDNGKHGFNDLVVAKDGDIFLTDTVSNQVYRFSPQRKTFVPLALSRELSGPNGIALSDDDQLFIADDFGLVRFDIAANSPSDVKPGPHNTLAGIDGLYYRKGTLIAVQNGIGQPRVVTFRLNRDNTSVTQTNVLENRTAFTKLPTTGALRENDFYFITNSGVDNLDGTRILDVTRLEPTRIAVVHLP